MLATDLATEQGCLEWMAYSPALNCLVGGTSGHACTYAVDVTTLALRNVVGIDAIETPFPGGGIAIGPVAGSSPAVERVFVSERRYDHIKTVDVVAGAGSYFELVQFDRLGDEGDDYMLAPLKLAFDAASDEIWVARGAYGGAPMIISVARASSRQKLGVIPTSALGGDAAVVAGIALSDAEAFVATGAAIKVFSRAEREEDVALADVDQLVAVDQETTRGYALKRELTLDNEVRDIIWSHGKLVVCTVSAVIVLACDGTELRHWTTAESLCPISEFCG